MFGAGAVGPCPPEPLQEWQTTQGWRAHPPKPTPSYLPKPSWGTLTHLPPTPQWCPHLCSFPHLQRIREQVGAAVGPGERPLPWPAASGEKGNSGPLTIWKVPLAQMKGAIPGGRGQPSTHSQTQFSWRRSLQQLINSPSIFRV